MKELTQNLELIPHVELDPNDYRSGKKRSQHKIPRREQGNYWAESFAMAGIEGVYPIEKNWWKAPLCQIHDERILLQLLKGIRHKVPQDDKSVESLAYRLEGGLTLVHDGEVIYRANCCSDLRNIDFWQEIARYRDSAWTLHWNGHPQIPVRYSEGMLHFADYSDDLPTSKSAAKYAIPPDVLKQAVKGTRQEIEAFQTRLNAYWETHQDKIWE